MTESRSTALAVMDRSKAMFLLKQVWPEATTEAIIRGAIICSQYDLNPLMKHVALIKFGNKYEPVLEIKATRIIAQRKHKYSFVDGPRVLTDREQTETFGEIDKENIVVMISLEEDGRRYPGYGRYPKDGKPYGSDKGNSKFNMAAIRAERNALDKLAPGELPQDIEVGDETYLPPVNLKAEMEKGKEQFLTDTKKETTLLYGNEEVKESPVAPSSPLEKTPTEAVKPSDNGLDLEWVKTSLNQLQSAGKESWSNKNIAKYLSNISGKIAPSVSKAVSLLTKEQAQQFKAEIESALQEK